eukprot:725399-Pleurochrysis_carterae.AAC.1
MEVVEAAAAGARAAAATRAASMVWEVDLVAEMMVAMFFVAGQMVAVPEVGAKEILEAAMGAETAAAKA